MKNIVVLILTFLTATICFGAVIKPAVYLNDYKFKPQSKVVVKPKPGIPIVAWIGVPQANTNITAYKEMYAAGITHSYFPFSDVTAVEKALNVAQKANIKLFVACPELISDPEATVRRFMNHPALAGYFIKDEPGMWEFQDIALILRRIRSVDVKHLCYINLLPNYASTDQLGTDSYQNYLQRYLSEVPVRILSFDHYAIIGNTKGAIRTEWYNNLELAAAAAKKANISLWAFALSTSFTPYPIPTLSTLRLQVYSDLAYGAQAIQYYTYWTLYDPAVANFNNASISNDGSVKTAVYPLLQKVNKEIQSLSGVFLGAKMQSVYFTGRPPIGTKPLKVLPRHIKVFKTSGLGALVSFMKNGMNSYFIVVNRDFTAKMNLTILCGAGVFRVLKNGFPVLQNQKSNTIQVEAGDIAVFKWYGKFD